MPRRSRRRGAAAHAHDLASYDTSPGTVRFRVDGPLPVPLVRKLLRLVPVTSLKDFARAAADLAGALFGKS